MRLQTSSNCFKPPANSPHQEVSSLETDLVVQDCWFCGMRNLRIHRLAQLVLCAVKEGLPGIRQALSRPVCTRVCGMAKLLCVCVCDLSPGADRVFNLFRALVHSSGFSG